MRSVSSVRAGLAGLLVLLVLTGCQPTVYLMPTPVALRTGELDPFEPNPNLERENRIRVDYATNRLPVGPKDHRYYTTFFDGAIRFGRAELQVGPKPISWKRLHAESTVAEREENRVLRLKRAREEAVLPADAPLDRLSPKLQRYFDGLNARIEASLHKDLTIYVHGANNNFYRTTAQAGQFRHFTGHNSVILVFAWPSAENIFRYGTDVKNAAATVPVFTRLLELLARHTTARHINVLAYSAGALIASPGLAALRERHADATVDELRARFRLGEIYFAAPDVDFRGFVRDLSRYLGMACNVTLTVNLDDTVLGLAQGYHGTSRAGRPDLDELTPEETRWLVEASRQEGFDVIDVGGSNIPAFSSGAHDFWYNNPWVSSDVLVQFLYHAGPAARGLQEVRTEEDASIWYFPEDYPERVVQAVHHLDQQPLDLPCGVRAGERQQMKGGGNGRSAESAGSAR